VNALLSETLVIVLFLRTDVGFLWYNVIGCAAVVLISATASTFLPKARGAAGTDLCRARRGDLIECGGSWGAG
jgi:hypothetical protein